MIKYKGIEFEKVEELIRYKKEYEDKERQEKPEKKIGGEERKETNILRRGKSWTREEKERVREIYEKRKGKNRKNAITRLVKEIGRTRRSIYQTAGKIGVTREYKKIGRAHV